MALAVLKLRKQMEIAQKNLDELRSGKDFKKREEELKKAYEQAETQEDIDLIEGELKTFEEERSAFQEEESKYTKVIEECRTEIEELENKQEAPKKNKEPEQKRSTGGHEMSIKIRNGFFRGMQRDSVEALVKRSEVKEFLTDIREGNILKESQTRAVKGAELGIPDVLFGLLRDNLHRYSKLISRVNLRRVGGKSRTNIVGDIPEAIWTEACAKLNELDIYFNQIEVDGYKVGGFIAVCNATLEDSDFSLANEIMDQLGQAIGLAVDKAILYGTGKKMPVGIVTRLAEKTKPPYWGDNAPSWENLSVSNIVTINEEEPQKMFAEIVRTSGKAKANYGTGGKFWAMNEETFTELQARLVTFNLNGALVSQMNNTMPVINGDIVILPFMEYGDIVGGYGSQYLLAERKGTQFASSEHVQFIQDNTVYKATARYDGKPILGNGFVAFNIVGEAPTTTVPFAPDEANEETP